MADSRQTFGDLSLLLPGAWKDTSTLSFVEPNEQAERSGYTHSITITREEVAPPLSLASYCDDQIAQLQANLPEFELMKRSPLQIHEREAVRIETEWKEFEGRRLHQVHYFVRAGQRVITVTGTALKDTFVKYQDEFDRITRSLQIR